MDIKSMMQGMMGPAMGDMAGLGSAGDTTLGAGGSDTPGGGFTGGQALEGLRELGPRIKAMVMSRLAEAGIGSGKLRNATSSGGAAQKCAHMGAAQAQPSTATGGGGLPAASAPISLEAALVPAPVLGAALGGPATSEDPEPEPAAAPEAPAPVEPAPAEDSVPAALASGHTPEDAALLAAAYRTAMRTAEGRAVLANMDRIDLQVIVTDDLPGNMVGRYTGIPEQSGVMRLSRAHLQRSPELGAALLAHEMRHGLAGGDEAQAEETERKVKEELGVPYVMD